MCFQTAETVESIVVQLMEKQRCARAAALSGKALDCPGCNDPNQECSLHHVPGENNFSIIQILIHPKLIGVDKCFVLPIFRFGFLFTFGDEGTKIWNLYLHFARQDRQDGKKPGKKITQNKSQKYGMRKRINMKKSSLNSLGIRIRSDANNLSSYIFYHLA